MVSFHYDDLHAGAYRARLRYTVKRSIEALNVDGSFHPPDQATLTKAKMLWEGTAVSDWIAFTVEPAPRTER